MGKIYFEIIGSVGVLVASAKALYEMSENRKQRKIEFKWKQTKEAKNLIDQMLDETASANTAIMIDSSGRNFQIDESQKVTITFEDIKNALRHDSNSFTKKEVFIRDCFDAFLFYVEFIEQSISNNLFEFKDVIFPMKYYVDCIVKNGLRDAVIKYIEYYQFSNSKNFLLRIEAWKNQFIYF